MHKVIVVVALSLAVVAPRSVQAQSLIDSIGHQRPASLTQTTSPAPASSGMSRRSKGALIGLTVGAGLGLFLSAGLCERGSSCASQLGVGAIFLGALGAGIGAAVSGDRSAPGVPGPTPSSRRIGTALTMRF
jgi:hypothetical protein